MMSHVKEVFPRRKFWLYVILAASAVGFGWPVFAVYEAEDLMYWTNSSSITEDGELGGVHRSGVQGGAIVAEGQAWPLGVAVDAASAKVFWTEDGTDTVHRADLNGANPEAIVTGTNARGIAAGGGRVYWTTSSRLRWANQDGSEARTIVRDLDYGAFFINIALDAAGGMMYWSDMGPLGEPRIARMDWEGVAQIMGGRMEIGDVAVHPGQGKVYWTEYAADGIFRANLDGTNVETVVPVDSPDGIALDTVSGKLYWTTGGGIYRANLDGSSVETLVTGLSGAYYVRLDRSGGKMYWTEMGADVIRRANLDGTFVENLVTGRNEPGGIALDLANGQMYWGELSAWGLYRADMDGSNIEFLLTTTLGGPLGVAVDPAGGRLYWTEEGGTISRANLNGTSPEELYSGYVYPYSLALQGGKLYWPTEDGSIYRASAAGIETLVSTLYDIGGIALDLADGKVYWTEMYAGLLRRADFDGSNAEDVLTGLLDPFAVAVDSTAGKLYWSQFADAGVYEANLDGTEPRQLFDSGDMTMGLAVDSTEGMLYWTGLDSGRVQRIEIDILTPLVGDQDGAAGVALDLERGKMYWVEAYAQIIHRANLDGSNVEDIITITEPVFPAGVALDLVHDKIYWTEIYGGSIRRANLDGTNIEAVRTNDGNGPSSIALDLVHSKMYWVDVFTQDIVRADLTGTSPQLVVPGQASDFGFALDLVDSKMYFVGPSSDMSIMRANLDGTSLEPAVPYVGTPNGMAIDKPNGKLYFTSGGSIRRVNMADGSGVETVWGALTATMGIALDVDTPPIIYEIDHANIYHGQVYRKTPALIQGSGPITWAITRPVSPPGNMAIDPDTGEVTWTANSAASPVYMTIAATGPGGSDTESWTIYVQDTGDVAPVIDEIPNATVSQGEAYEVTPMLLEGSPPFTWSLTVPSPLPGDMAVDPDTGVVTWTADGAVSPLNMTLQVVGGAGTDTESWRITVEMPPPNVITSWPPPGFIEEGCLLTLSAPPGSGYYRWYRGSPLDDDPPRITGTTSQRLVIDGVLEDDEGIYTCVYDNDTGKAFIETEPYLLVVLPAGSLPAAGGLALGALAGFLALGGGSALWRRLRAK